MSTSEALEENIKYFDSLDIIGIRPSPSDISYRLRYIKKLYEQEKKGGDQIVKTQ